jgi:hypothetical protein
MEDVMGRGTKMGVGWRRTSTVLWLNRERVGPIHLTRWTVHLLLLMLVVLLLLLWHRHTLSSLLHWHERSLFRWTRTVVVLRLRRRHLVVV